LLLFIDGTGLALLSNQQRGPDATRMLLAYLERGMIGGVKR